MEPRARWPLPRVALLSVLALAMWALKRHYALAEVGELSWILKPVASLSALVSGATFEWEPGSGYLSRERLFVIAKPCAGVNFMLAALGMVGVMLSKRAVSWRASASLAALSWGIAYIATVMANTTRIAVALWIAAHPFTTDLWTPARVHRMEGIAIYFGMLVALHVVVQRLAEKWDAVIATLPRFGLPLAFYDLVTVFIPLANGSGDASRAFLEHLAMVVLAPPTLVGLVALARRAPKGPPHRRSPLHARHARSEAPAIGRSVYTQTSTASLQDKCIDVKHHLDGT
ncbi:MAG TPA: exosortase K [Polyangiaceae bacterium]|nr:exosortase K [Polyangiaceae bacterium]